MLARLYSQMERESLVEDVVWVEGHSDQFTSKELHDVKEWVRNIHSIVLLKKEIEK